MALITEKRCAACKKLFVVPYEELWVFRRGEIWFCKNSCLMEYENKKKFRHHNRRLDKDEVSEVKRLLREGMNYKQVAEIVGASPGSIYYYVEKMRAEADSA